MNPLVREKLDDLVRVCVRHRVRRLELFGSATDAVPGKDFDPATSDLDFLVDFEELGPGEHADAYFGLLDDLHGLFDRRIDLVMTGAIKNPYFRDSIQSSRTVVYAA